MPITGAFERDACIQIRLRVTERTLYFSRARALRVQLRVPTRNLGSVPPVLSDCLGCSIAFAAIPGTDLQSSTLHRKTRADAARQK